jgi:hypothetical protein
VECLTALIVLVLVLERFGLGAYRLTVEAFLKPKPRSRVGYSICSASMKGLEDEYDFDYANISSKNARIVAHERAAALAL